MNQQNRRSRPLQEIDSSSIVAPCEGLFSSVIEKQCTKCEKVKMISDFGADKRRPGGRSSWCKACLCCYQHLYQKLSPKHRATKKRWKKANPEKVKESAKRWYKKNTNKAIMAQKLWKLKNKDRSTLSQKKYYARKKEEIARFRIEHPEQAKALDKRANTKRRSTPKGKLHSRMSTSVYDSLKDGSKRKRHWEDLVGYTVDQLKQHLEKKFKPGMNWDNMGKWHIDHKIPVAVFNFEKSEDIDFRRCWALNNIQPLWAGDNMQKHAKVDRPFQPMLAF